MSEDIAKEVYGLPPHTSLFLHPHAGGHAEGGGNGRKDGDSDVDDFLPKFVLVHGSLVFSC